jgi:hypothetical protein
LSGPKDRQKSIIISFNSPHALGPRLIASNSSKHGFQTTLISMGSLKDKAKPTTEQMDTLARYLCRERPNFIGMSVGSTNLQAAIETTAACRQTSNSPVVWGGVHPTLMPNESLAHADYVAVGRGEHIWTHLLGSHSCAEPKEPHPTQGLWWRATGRTHEGGVASSGGLPCAGIFKHDPSSFVISRTGIVSRVRQSSTYETIASSGCFFSCEYCANDALRKLDPNLTIRQVRPPAEVVEELQAVLSRNRPKFIYFFDDIFPTQLDWLEEFSRRYRDNVSLPFFIFCHPRLVNEKSLTLLKKAGLAHVSMGIQSATEEVRNSVFGRTETNRQIAQAASILARVGVRRTFDMILSPFETEFDFTRSFEFLASLPPPFELNVFHLAFFPKTSITVRALRHQLISENEIVGNPGSSARTMGYSVEDSPSCWPDLLPITGYTFLSQRSKIRLMYHFTGDKRRYWSLRLFCKLCQLYEICREGSFAMRISRTNFGVLPKIIQRQCSRFFSDDSYDYF